jgi:hypothetical protein
MIVLCHITIKAASKQIVSSTALITTSMPTSRRRSMSSSSKYYGKTASKVTFSTTSQQNIHAQPTNDKTTFYI